MTHLFFRTVAMTFLLLGTSVAPFISQSHAAPEDSLHKSTQQSFTFQEWGAWERELLPKTIDQVYDFREIARFAYETLADTIKEEIQPHLGPEEKAEALFNPSNQIDDPGWKIDELHDSKALASLKKLGLANLILFSPDPKVAATKTDIETAKQHLGELSHNAELPLCVRQLAFFLTGCVSQSAAATNPEQPEQNRKQERWKALKRFTDPVLAENQGISWLTSLANFSAHLLKFQLGMVSYSDWLLSFNKNIFLLEHFPHYYALHFFSAQVSLAQNSPQVLTLEELNTLALMSKTFLETLAAKLQPGTLLAHVNRILAVFYFYGIGAQQDLSYAATLTETVLKPEFLASPVDELMASWMRALIQAKMNEHESSQNALALFYLSPELTPERRKWAEAILKKQNPFPASPAPKGALNEVIRLNAIFLSASKILPGGEVGICVRDRLEKILNTKEEKESSKDEARITLSAWYALYDKPSIGTIHKIKPLLLKILENRETEKEVAIDDRLFSSLIMAHLYEAEISLSDKPRSSKEFKELNKREKKYYEMAAQFARVILANKDSPASAKALSIESILDFLRIHAVKNFEGFFDSTGVLESKDQFKEGSPLLSILADSALCKGSKPTALQSHIISLYSFAISLKTGLVQDNTESQLNSLLAAKTLPPQLLLFAQLFLAEFYQIKGNYPSAHLIYSELLKETAYSALSDPMKAIVKIKKTQISEKIRPSEEKQQATATQKPLKKKKNPKTAIVVQPMIKRDDSEVIEIKSPLLEEFQPPFSFPFPALVPETAPLPKTEILSEQKTPILETLQPTAMPSLQESYRAEALEAEVAENTAKAYIAYKNLLSLDKNAISDKERLKVSLKMLRTFLPHQDTYREVEPVIAHLHNEFETKEANPSYREKLTAKEIQRLEFLFQRGRITLAKVMLTSTIQSDSGIDSVSQSNREEQIRAGTSDLLSFISSVQSIIESSENHPSGHQQSKDVMRLISFLKEASILINTFISPPPGIPLAYTQEGSYPVAISHPLLPESPILRPVQEPQLTQQVQEQDTIAMTHEKLIRQYQAIVEEVDIQEQRGTVSTKDQQRRVDAIRLSKALIALQRNSVISHSITPAEYQEEYPTLFRGPNHLNSQY